jgi:hypothetical protein
LTSSPCYISHHHGFFSAIGTKQLRLRSGSSKRLGDTLADPDLNFLARQNERILAEIASLRDDMAVLTAMVMRLDGSHAALLQETRATHAQITRMNDRIRKLEAEGEVR